MKKKHFLLLSLILLLTSCGDSGNSILEKIDYIPFRSEQGGNWGLISTDGEVLFADEFKNRPTVAMHDRFIVENTDGMYEIYSAEKNPKQVGEAFKSIGVFIEEVTPAVRPGQPVTLVNTEGEEVAKLDKLDGKVVTKVTNFNEGIAIYTTADGLCGAIDTDGKVVVKAEYAELNPCFDGKMIGIGKKQKELINDGMRDKAKISVIDKKGKVIGEIPMGKFSEIGPSFQNGVVQARTEEDGERCTGLIDEKGEWVVKPSAKTKNITEVRGKQFVYYDGDSYGLMDFDGDVLIRAKYDMLSFMADGLLVAKKSGSGKYKYLFIDDKGENVGDERFKDVDMPILNSGYALVELERDSYGFVDKKGKIKKTETDICDIHFGWANFVIESDYVDIDAVIAAMGLTQEGIDGLTFGTTARDVANHIAQLKGSGRQAEAKDYTYTSVCNYTKQIGRAGIAFTITCDGSIAEYTASAGGGYGYAFTDARITGFGLMINKNDGYGNSMKKLAEKLRRTVKGLGKVSDERNEYFEVTTAKGTTIQAAMSEEVIYINLIPTPVPAE